jgi:type III secretion system FlhB-like substrate exporter
MRPLEVDEEIPPEHYKTVEVIGYVMRLRRAVAR